MQGTTNLTVSDKCAACWRRKPPGARICYQQIHELPAGMLQQRDSPHGCCLALAVVPCGAVQPPCMVSTGDADGCAVAEAPLTTTLLVRQQHGVLPHCSFASDGLALGGFISGRDFTHSIARTPAHGGLCLLCCCRGGLHSQPERFRWVWLTSSHHLEPQNAWACDGVSSTATVDLQQLPAAAPIQAAQLHRKPRHCTHRQHECNHHHQGCATSSQRQRHFAWTPSATPLCNDGLKT